MQASDFKSHIVRYPAGAEPTPLPPTQGVTLVLVSRSAQAAHPRILGVILRDRMATTLTRVMTPLPSVRSLADTASSVDLDEVTSVVAFGGGSTMDSAKVLAAVQSSESLASTAPLQDLLVAERQRELVVIPTTAGSGAEITPFASIWTSDGASKISVERPDLAPDQVILTPSLLASCRTEQILSSLLDAIGHCADSLWNRRSNDTSEELARRGLKVAATVLPSVGQQAAAEIAADLQEVSLLGGQAISMTRTSIAHALSYYFTRRHGVPHGDAVAMFIPAISRFLTETNHALAGDSQLEKVATAVAALDLCERYANALANASLEDAIESAMASTRLANFVVSDTHAALVSILRDTLPSSRST